MVYSGEARQLYSQSYLTQILTCDIDEEKREHATTDVSNPLLRDWSMASRLTRERRGYVNAVDLL